MFCWSLVDLRVHACEPDLFSMWPKVLSPWHWHYALGPDGVTSRDFLEEWYLFTLLLLHKRDDLSADPFNFEPKPMRDVGRETAIHRAPVVFPPKRQKGTRPIYQATNEMEGEGWLQTFARNKNEKTAERCVDQCYPRKAHECALVEEFPVIQVSTDSTRGEKA